MRSKKTIYNISSSLLLQIIIVIYGFIVPKLIISNFGSATNGLATSITQFLSYIVLLESGFGPVVKAALYKPIAKNDKAKIANILAASERFFRTIAKIFLTYILVLCVLYPLVINKEFGFLYTASLILIISVSSFAEYYFGMTYSLYLQAEQKNYISSLIQSALYIINIVVFIILIKFNLNIHIIKLAMGLVFVLRPLIQNYYVKKKYNINLKAADKEYSLKQKWDGLIQHIAYVIHINTDVSVITIFCNLAEVSVYSVYALVVRGIKSLIQSFGSGTDALFGAMIANEEHENLNEKFSIYETAYFTIVTIFYTCTMVLIVPFITVYTMGVTDANYIRQSFGYLIVISEYIWAFRFPYSSITLAAGHFKQTKIGAIVEAVSNIVISIILVRRYGIVGVAIGTIVAMLIRTVEFMYHSNKYILKRNVWSGSKKAVLTIIETILIVFLANYLPMLNNVSYLNWVVNALMVLVISTVVVLLINSIFYFKDYKKIINIIKNAIKRKKTTQ